MISFAVVCGELFFLFQLSDRLTKTLYTLLYFVFRSKNVTVALLTFIFLPGTIVHELAHLFTAEILRVPTGDISFTPEIRKNHLGKAEIRVGHVTHAATDPIRTFLIGIAPFFWGIGILTLIVWLFQYFWGQFSDIKQQILLVIGIGYLLFAVSNSMFTSKKDMEGSEYFLPVMIFLLIAAYIAGIRFNLTGQSLKITQQLLTGLSQALGVVLVVNTLIFLTNIVLLQGLRKLFKVTP